MLTAAILTASLVGGPSAQQPCVEARQVVAEAYRQVLERAPDPSSTAAVTALDSGRLSVRELIRRLARSPEHVDRFFWQPLVTVVYRQVLGRAPTLAELQQATSALSGDRETVTQLVANTAVRAANGDSEAVRILYRRLLGRDPDPGGLQTYTEMARRDGIDAVVQSLLASPDYLATAGQDHLPALDAAAYQGAVTTLYRHVIAREPDPAGLRDLTRIAVTRGVDAVVDRLVDSPEYLQSYGNDAVPGHVGEQLCHGVGTAGAPR